MTINWTRIAQPQSDLYDTQTIIALLQEKYAWTKRQPTSQYRLCANTVGIVLDPVGTDSNNPNRVDALERVTPEIVEELNRFLTAWPEGSLVLQAFLDEFWPKWSTVMTNPRLRGESGGHYELRSSLHDGPTKGILVHGVYSTLNDLQGCSEGIYRGVAHQRLEALGINLDSHDSRLLLNDNDAVYPLSNNPAQSMRISELVQLTYSRIMIAEAHLQCAQNLTGLDTKQPARVIPFTPKEASAVYIRAILSELKSGLSDVRQYAQLTPEGVLFMDGYFAWGESVIARSEYLLAIVKNIIAPVVSLRATSPNVPAPV